MCDLCTYADAVEEPSLSSPEAMVRVKAKLHALGDFEHMSDDEWGEFLNALPPEEFLALVALGAAPR